LERFRYESGGYRVHRPHHPSVFQSLPKSPEIAPKAPSRTPSFSGQRADHFCRPSRSHRRPLVPACTDPATSPDPHE